MDTKKINHIYSFYSGFYDAFFGRIFAPGRLRAIELMNLAPNEEVLEVGVGTGMALPLYPDHVRVVGIDLCADMLEKAKTRKEALGLKHVSLVEMDATRMSFPDNWFHKVVAAHVITVVPEPLKVIEEMKRVCKHSGEIYLIQYIGSKESLFDRLWTPFRKSLGLGDVIDIYKIIKEAGLKIEHEEGVNAFKFCTLLKCRKPLEGNFG